VNRIGIGIGGGSCLASTSWSCEDGMIGPIAAVSGVSGLGERGEREVMLAIMRCGRFSMDAFPRCCSEGEGKEAQA
jgi:hypothetical protein